MLTSAWCIVYRVAPQISMNVKQQLTTAMDWPFVTIILVLLTACVGLTTLAMVCLVNLLVSEQKLCKYHFLHSDDKGYGSVSLH